MRPGNPRPVTTRIEAPTQTGAETQRYIEITPAETTPTPRTVQRGFRRLYAHLQPEDSGGLLGLFGDQPATLEFLLVSAGGEAAPMRYLVGTTENEADLSGLETILRSVFPNSYDLDRVECHPEALLSPATTGEADTTDDIHENGPYVAGIRFTPDCDHPLDWQTRLATYGDGDRRDRDSRPEYRRGARSRTSREARQADESDEGTPLAGLAETMATAEFPIVYQVLLRPKADWSAELEDRRFRIEEGRDSVAARVFEDLIGSPGYDEDDTGERRLSATAAQRLDELRAKDARRSFEVTARAAVVAPPSYWETPRPVHETARRLATTLSPAGHTTQDVTGRIRTDEGFHDGCVPPGQRVLEALVDRERAPSPPTSELKAKFGSDAHALVADVAEAPSLCVLGGAGLPATAQRGLDPTASERTAIVPPAPRTLQRYRGEGMYLGHVKDADGQTQTDRLVLPPELQTTHSLVLGKSGSGKSVLAQTALRTNHAATDGPTIIVDRKGDGLPEEYLQTHYREYDDLEDVLYFDCSRLLPALSILDIRPDLEVGRPRVSAIEDRADFLEEVLRMRATEETYERSIRSPDILQYLLKAGFDTVHGDDVLTYAELQGMVTRLQDQREPPAASHPAVADGLTSVAANASRSFDDVMEAVKARLEKLQTDSRLYRLFNYAPEDRDGDMPLFSFDELLDEDVVIVFDTSDMRADSQKAFVLVVLAQLWDALKRREQARGNSTGQPAAADGGATDRQSDDGDSVSESPLDTATGKDAQASADSGGEPPLVNLFIEEAAEVAASDLVTQFLRQARGFNCAVTLAMQFPEQLRHEHPEAYEELLNDVSTIIAGNVGHDRRLAERFATDDMPADAVANRLRALEKGEWLVTLPAPFGDAEPRPFLIESAPLPPGHPDGPEPLSPARETAFKGALDVCQHRTATEYGLPIQRDRPVTTDHSEAGHTPADAIPATDTDAEAETEPSIQLHELRSALPHTKRLPEMLTYDADAHSISCEGCGTSYAASFDKLRDAIECCNSLDIVDRDDIPICDVPLTLSPEDCLDSPYSVQQLLFLQAVVTAKRGGYDPDLEYDLRRDSMVRLREYISIEQDAVDELVADGLLNRDGDHPHRLYTVTHAGLELIDEQRREGITHGDGIGDLGESSLHRVMVLDGAALLDQEFVDDTESAAVEVRTYYETDGYRYDAVALDSSGEIVAAVEAERTNHDLLDAAPEDYDKLAAVDPEAAIWIVENRSGAHAVLEALNNPNDNVQRIEKTYSESTAPRFFKIDSPGLTDVHTLGYLRNSVLE
ncbi:DUF87 domain-containing protein [Natronomonas halophila]|uniref:helicase HerA domain-containing protein n=1 Tax=Natronomonas halophila TaxID=2747817 RepID=UPI0015B3EE74|nr:DUF87 domain-containing protein [Natronomonas halophila]QLD87057.1 DUF87 domain-containing protein [Natronomonas halophila]